jgi:hypothetical protein
MQRPCGGFLKPSCQEAKGIPGSASRCRCHRNRLLLACQEKGVGASARFLCPRAPLAAFRPQCRVKPSPAFEGETEAVKEDNDGDDVAEDGDGGVVMVVMMMMMGLYVLFARAQMGTLQILLCSVMAVI